MRDRRNSYNELGRFNQASNGRAKGSKQKRYLVWHRWGVQHASLGLPEFIQAYTAEFARVRAYNRKNFGTDEVWEKHRKKDDSGRKVGTYYLTYEAETFLKTQGLPFPKDLE